MIRVRTMDGISSVHPAAFCWISDGALYLVDEAGGGIAVYAEGYWTRAEQVDPGGKSSRPGSADTGPGRLG